MSEEESEEESTHDYVNLNRIDEIKCNVCYKTKAKYYDDTEECFYCSIECFRDKIYECYC